MRENTEFALKRKDFLKSIFVSGAVFTGLANSCNSQKDSSPSNLGLLQGILDTSSCNTSEVSTSSVCALIPQETEGPYPLDLSSNSSYFRQDITEGKTGIPLSLVLTIQNINDNCNPISNARVDIWHCDKDGYYSGYSESGYLGAKNYIGETFCRGIQLTDSSGIVNFTTIYPGWYSGRVTHIHFQVYLNNGLVATSQIAFPEDITKTVYNTSLYSAHGQNTSVPGNCYDNIFNNSSSDLSLELCTITEDSSTGGYIASLTIGIAN
ncbi:protocatechuate dioxygenase [Leptospira selangorensis]|uniref:Protocatechuate dioxygenase n=1 Tax=Leptospira selangorensis TaxID=2484982 RepID=A0A5F2BWL1_9LEPT|nr:protocatechuate dioxygenase [Leptospira selangorensis]TGM14481.1 protocatechuate dioxygenase [Leptospira selangorensis]